MWRLGLCCLRPAPQPSSRCRRGAAANSRSSRLACKPLKSNRTQQLDPVVTVETAADATRASCSESLALNWRPRCRGGRPYEYPTQPQSRVLRYTVLNLAKCFSVYIDEQIDGLTENAASYRMVGRRIALSPSPCRRKRRSSSCKVESQPQEGVRKTYDAAQQLPRTSQSWGLARFTKALQVPPTPIHCGRVLGMW